MSFGTTDVSLLRPLPAPGHGPLDRVMQQLFRSTGSQLRCSCVCVTGQSWPLDRNGTGMAIGGPSQRLNDAAILVVAEPFRPAQAVQAQTASAVVCLHACALGRSLNDRVPTRTASLPDMRRVGCLIRRQVQSQGVKLTVISKCICSSVHTFYV